MIICATYNPPFASLHITFKSSHHFCKSLDYFFKSTLSIHVAFKLSTNYEVSIYLFWLHMQLLIHHFCKSTYNFCKSLIPWSKSTIVCVSKHLNLSSSYLVSILLYQVNNFLNLSTHPTFNQPFASLHTTFASLQFIE